MHSTGLAGTYAFFRGLWSSVGRGMWLQSMCELRAMSSRSTACAELPWKIHRWPLLHDFRQVLQGFDTWYPTTFPLRVCVCVCVYVCVSEKEEGF
jgi:hypothetical protein